MRRAEFSRLFYLAEREVSNAQFRAFASGHDSGAFQEQTLDDNEQPVTNISWHEAAAYCNWLSEQEGFASFYEIEFGKVVATNPAATGYRLPTEASGLGLHGGNPATTTQPRRAQNSSSSHGVAPYRHQNDSLITPIALQAI